MKDASATRRSIGKLGILVAAAVILPLTATIVPAIHAQEAQNDTVIEPVTPTKTASPIAPVAPVEPAAPPKMVKVVNISIGKTTDGKPSGKVVQKISRDGTTYIFRSEKPFSQAELDKVIADTKEAERQTAIALTEVDKADRETAKAMRQADGAQVAADNAMASAEIARGMAEANRVMANAAAYVPEIDIKEITKNCSAGQPVTTDVQGFDGNSKSRIKIVMCGKGQARIARVEAIKGLREARNEIGNDKDMPDGIRKDVMKQLNVQIRKLEAESTQAD